MNPAITFDPLCPDCGHEMMDVFGKWECLNPECGTIELKAPDNCSAEIDQGSVVDRGAVTMPQDKESMALVRQKGDFSAEY
jgi:hypothetical protein